jgi:hypothetical protein
MSRAGKKPKKRRIVGGVDTHADTHHTAVELMHGGRVADAQFPVTRQGYEQLLEWMRSFGRLHAVGVEGTGSYGAGLARHLRGEGVTVIEVNRPDRRQRRAKGKSDPLDAYAAADAVLAGRATALPKGGNGIIESIRMVHLTRAGAMKARTACINELRSLLVTAPAELRERLSGLSAEVLAQTCTRLRPIGAVPARPVNEKSLDSSNWRRMHFSSRTWAGRVRSRDRRFYCCQACRQRTNGAPGCACVRWTLRFILAVLDPRGTSSHKSKRSFDRMVGRLEK